MKNIHVFYENNPLDFSISGAYILYQTLGQIAEGPTQGS
jgi:hypothetical protein